MVLLPRLPSENVAESSHVGSQVLEAPLRYLARARDLVARLSQTFSCHVTHLNVNLPRVYAKLRAFLSPKLLPIFKTRRKAKTANVTTTTTALASPTIFVHLTNFGDNLAFPLSI